MVLLEAKASKDTERLTTFTTLEGWEPASIPTLEYERVITEDGSAAVNSNDIMGTRLRVDYAIVPGMFTPYVATTLLIDKDTEGLHFNDSEETILHPMAGVEWQKGHWAAQFNAGMRTDKRKDTAEGSDRMVHVDGTFHFPALWRRGAGSRHRRQEVRVGRQRAAARRLPRDGERAGLASRREVGLCALPRLDNNLPVQSEGNLQFIGDNVYGALEAQYKPSGNITYKAFYGAYKAGIRCSGGQCRACPASRARG